MEGLLALSILVGMFSLWLLGSKGAMLAELTLKVVLGSGEEEYLAAFLQLVSVRER